MSTETTVKKRSRTKKALAGEEEAVVADDSLPSEAPVKRTRAKKSVSKVLEEAVSEDASVEISKVRKLRETKKKEVAKTTAKTSTSKRAAKAEGNELQLEKPAGSILSQATAFADARQEAGKETAASVGQRGDSQEIQKDLNAQPMVPKIDKKATPTTASSKATSNISPIKSKPDLPTKPSPFLNSFLNDPEPGPVPPPQHHQERIETPQESRAELKQTTKHDFPDSILSAHGKVKEQQSSASPSATAATIAAAMTQEPPPLSLPEAQIRAFTTTSFKTLKTSNLPTSQSAMATGKRIPPKPHPSKLAPPPRPTSLPYDQLIKDPQYRALKRKWTAGMVAIPIAIATGYELYRRWERGDYGRSRSMLAESEGDGERRLPGRGASGFDAGRRREDDVVGDGVQNGGAGLEKGSVARDVDGDRLGGGEVMGRLPGVEIESGGGDTWIRRPLQGESKEGWVKVFK